MVAIKQPSLATSAELGLIKFENVGLRYGLGTEVLSDLTFEIAPTSFSIHF